MSDIRATTHSQSADAPDLLAPPLASFRRRRSPTRDERLRSPNNFEDEANPVFNFNMATPKQLAALRDELRAEIRNEMRNETMSDFEERTKFLLDILVGRGYKMDLLRREFSKAVEKYISEFQRWTIPVNFSSWFDKISLSSFTEPVNDH